MLVIGPESLPLCELPSWFSPKRPVGGYRFVTEPLFPPMEIPTWGEPPPDSPEGGWLPISEAPRDGTPIDLWSAENEDRIADAYWSGTTKLRRNEEHRWHAPNQDYDGDSGWIGNGYRITHWMPKPPPPPPQDPAR